MATEASRKRSAAAGHHQYGSLVTLADGTTAFLPSSSIVNPADATVQVAVDSIGEGLVVIDADHYRVHLGQAYFSSLKISTLGAGASFDILLTNPADNYPHLRSFAGVMTSGPCDVFVYEDTTVSSAGTGVAAVNMNRSSANTADLVLTHTPTVTRVGTQLEYTMLPAGHKQGGVWASVAIEWILKPSANYMFRLTNNDNSAVDGGLEFFWYES